MPSLTIAECTRRWGAYTVSGTTPQDGFYFELSDADVLSVNHVNGSSVTKVSSGAFNGSVASFAMDTNVHFYEVVYFEAKAQFIIDKVLIHEFTPTIAKLNAGLTIQSLLPQSIRQVEQPAGQLKYSRLLY